MATSSYISLITLTYYVFILSVCQINLSMALSLYQYKTYPVPDQQKDDRLVLFNEYHPQNYPLNQQLEFPYNTPVYVDSKEILNTDEETIPRINWAKRDLRPNNQANKRMLCFFHTVNCFG